MALVYDACWIGNEWYVVVGRSGDSLLYSRWWFDGAWQPDDWQQLEGGAVDGEISLSVNALHAHVAARIAADGSLGHWYFDGSWHYENLGGAFAAAQL
jgi:hypothetical protein